jgi:hypothetical protein
MSEQHWPKYKNMKQNIIERNSDVEEEIVDEDDKGDNGMTL